MGASASTQPTKAGFARFERDPDQTERSFETIVWTVVWPMVRLDL